MLYFTSETSEPLVGAFAHRHAHPTATDRLRKAQLDPPEILDAKHRPPPIDCPETTFNGFEAKAVMDALAARRRIARAASKEGRVGAIKIAQRLRKRSVWNRCDPVYISTKFGDLAPLADEIEPAACSGMILPPERLSLLQRQIVDEARRADKLSKLLGLFWSGI